jgi:hypothetical protein
MSTAPRKEKRGKCVPIPVTVPIYFVGDESNKYNSSMVDMGIPMLLRLLSLMTSVF